MHGGQADRPGQAGVWSRIERSGEARDFLQPCPERKKEGTRPRLPGRIVLEIGMRAAGRPAMGMTNGGAHLGQIDLNARV